MKIWTHAAEFSPEKGSPLGWMATIVRNRALDVVRKARWERPVGEDDARVDRPEEGSSPLEQVIAGQEGEALKRCLGELEPEPREAILLAFWRGLSHQELSKRLKRPLGTVKSWVRRGLERLKGCLEA